MLLRNFWYALKIIFFELTAKLCFEVASLTATFARFLALSIPGLALDHWAFASGRILFLTMLDALVRSSGFSANSLIPIFTTVRRSLDMNIFKFQPTLRIYPVLTDPMGKIL